jgi:hypothetical protein
LNNLVNFALFQLGWFATVWLGAGAQPEIAALPVLAVLIIHLYLSPQALPELRIMGLALLIGLAWENLLAIAGLVVYPSGQPLGHLAPLWLLALWPLLASTLNVSLRWLRGSTGLAVAFGAVGGPLAFLAGERLGAVQFPAPIMSLALLSAGWALLFPLLVRLAVRHDGFAVTTPEPVQVAP